MDTNGFLKIRTQAYITIGFTAAGLLSVSLIHSFLPTLTGEMTANRLNSVIALLGTTLFAIGFPILLRTGYFQKGTKNQGLHLADFLQMKRLIGYSVGIGVIFMLFAYYLPIYTYHLYLSVLVGIYGIYSIFPSKSTYQKELRSFGVLDDND
jgi:hypothetical protein